MSLIDQITIFGDLPLAQLYFKEIKNVYEALYFEEDEYTIGSIRKVSLVNIRIRTIESPSLPFLGLTYLNISFNRISEINGIAHLTKLRTLDISHNKIFDLSPISKAISMEILRADSNLIESLKPLTNFSKMKQLFLGNNNLIWEEMSHLENMKKIEVLHIVKNPLDKKAKIFDFLYAFKPTLKYINGIIPEILLKITVENGTINCANDNYNRINNDILHADINTEENVAAVRNNNFFRSSDGKIMTARARAYLLKSGEKIEQKLNIEKKNKEISWPLDSTETMEERLIDSSCMSSRSNGAKERKRIKEKKIKNVKRDSSDGIDDSTPPTKSAVILHNNIAH